MYNAKEVEQDVKQVMQGKFNEIDLAATKSREKRLIEEVAELKEKVKELETKHTDSVTDYEKKIAKLD